MENISKMEMAKALFEKPYIKVEKKFFGFITNITYTPTNSPIVGLCLDYALADGEKVKQLAFAAPGEVVTLIKKDGKPETSPNGHWRLSLCYSKDRKFAALCFSEFVGFEYKTIEGPRFLEGDDAGKILQAFVK
jgi:hypothetical protein